MMARQRGGRSLFMRSRRQDGAQKLPVRAEVRGLCRVGACFSVAAQAAAFTRAVAMSAVEKPRLQPSRPLVSEAICPHRHRLQPSLCR